jgi:hypothetical protein
MSKTTLLCVTIFLTSCTLPDEYYYDAADCHDDRAYGYIQEEDRIVKYKFNCITEDEKLNPGMLVMMPGWLLFLMI